VNLASAWDDVVDWCSHNPVSAVAAVICVIVWLATGLGLGAAADGGIASRSRAWGSIEVLHLRELAAPEREAEKGLYGFLDLWEGEWWRLWVVNFHHAGPIHLLLNLSALVYLANYVELRLGSWKTLALVVVAAPASMLPEYLLESQAVGFSGVICSYLGVMLGLRWLGEAEDWLLPRSFERDSLIGLVMLAVLSSLSILPIANWAHAAGLCCGVLFVAAACRVPFEYATASDELAAKAPVPLLVSLRVSISCVGLLLIAVGVYAAAHPVWLARYHWYQANRAEDPQARVAGYRRAVQIDPQLPLLWLRLIEVEMRTNGLVRALRESLTAIKSNTDDERLWDVASLLWAASQLEVGNPVTATLLKEVHGDNAPEIKEQLERLVATRMPGRQSPGNQSVIASPNQESLDEPAIDLLGPAGGAAADQIDPGRPNRVPFDPDNDTSAAEGVNL
jgi:membrane associated rhomboid family serine protease